MATPAGLRSTRLRRVAAWGLLTTTMLVATATSAAPPIRDDRPASAERREDRRDGAAGTEATAVPGNTPPVDANAANRGSTTPTDRRNSASSVLVLAHLTGSDEAKGRVAERLAGALSPAPSVSAANGFVIGVAEDLDAAIAWSIERLVPVRAGRLDDVFALDLREAPFAGVLAEDVARGDAVALLAVEIATMGVDGVVKAIDSAHLLTAAPDGATTPSADAATRLALDVGAIAPTRAPLFAAPAHTLPPIDEAHAVPRRGDEVLVFGQRDLCAASTDDQPTQRPCIRWLQLVVRSRGRLLAGWMPAAWVVTASGVVARDEGPSPSPSTSVRVRPSHVARGHAHFVVRGDESSARRTAGGIASPARDLRVPTREDGGFPRLTVERDGDGWFARLPDGTVLAIELDLPIPRQP